jgi:uncharacterized membrane protein YfcA
MSKPKKLFEPQSTAELLRGWLIHAHKGRDRHDLAARVYERARYLFGVPTLVVSTAVGTAVFSSLASNESPRWWVGLLSVLAAVLSALQTFLDFPTRAERHRIAGVKYKAIIRSLEQALSELGGGAQLAPTAVASLRAELDALEDEAPVIMPRIFDRVEKRYSGVAYVQEALGLYK